MRKFVRSIFLLLAFVFSFTPSIVLASEFCSGFESGYITGYKQASGSGFDPFTPFCPFQPFKNSNDPQSDFEHGYIIGYEKGIQDGNK